MAASVIEETLIEVIRSLPVHQQIALLEVARCFATEPRGPRKSMLGLWKDLNISISEEDIAEARREMWGGATEVNR